jgi:hypothetical protein
MKKLLFIALVVTLALGVVWVPSVAAALYPIEIVKTIPAGGPAEDFTFEAWRDFNNNGVIDAGDSLRGTEVITGAGTCIIYVDYKGPYVIHEVLIAGSVYEQPADEITDVPQHEPVTFENEGGGGPQGELVIVKADGNGDPLAGACFTITPDPRTGADSLELCDNDGTDECPEDGVFCLSDCILDLVCTVEETTVPPGHEGADPQTVTISGLVEVTFVNTKCELTIYKVDGSGDPLAGACFNITPDPTSGVAGSVLTVCDNGLNDECPAEGVLCLSDLICNLEVTVEETVVPPSCPECEPADPQTVVIGETLELTFENTITPPSCGTVCAAQTAPGEFLFDLEQENWFTWIYYNIGWGTSEDDAYEYPIYTGATTLCGTLYVYDNGTHIFVNYVLTDTATCTLGGLSEYHLEVDESLSDLKKHVMNKKNPVPGKCEYKGYFDPMVTESGWIEADNKSDDISDWDIAYIFAHGVGCYYCP